jgi:SAM-dependent methyltransferase
VIERSALDWLELAALWFGGMRHTLIDQVRRYLTLRIQYHQMRAVPDVTAAARLIIETTAFFALHRHFDPYPTTIGDAVAEATVVDALSNAYVKPNVHTLYGLDPSYALWQMARQRAARAPFAIEYLQCSGEHIPLAAQTCDTVVSTWTLCTIPQPLQALREMRRGLKPDGRLMFIEHGRPRRLGPTSEEDTYYAIQRPRVVYL